MLYGLVGAVCFILGSAIFFFVGVNYRKNIAEATIVSAEEQAEKVNPNAILFLQPEWSKKDEMTPLIVDYVMKNPKWRVSLQTHKYLNIP